MQTRNYDGEYSFHYYYIFSLVSDIRVISVSDFLCLLGLAQKKVLFTSLLGP